MRGRKFRIILILMLFIFIIQFSHFVILSWLGLPESSIWYWLLDEGSTLTMLILLVIIFALERSIFREVQESEQLYRTLTEISPNSVVIYQDDKITYANPSAVKIVGLSGEQQLIGKSLFDCALHRDLADQLKELINKVLQGKQLDFTEFQVTRLDGQVLDVEAKFTLIQLNGKSAIMIIGRDITERKELERALAEGKERYRIMVESSPIGVATHKFGEIVYVNPAGVKNLGAASTEDLIGRNILDFIHPDYHEAIKDRWKTMRNEHRCAEFLEEKMTRLDQQVIDVEVAGLLIELNGEHLVQIFFQDITDRKKAQKLIHQMAYQDPLTGLCNRRFFEESLNKAISIATILSQKVLAVMFIDLDGFKQVNDTLGHDVGDLLLKNIAERLHTCVRENDIIARLAGDEFTILLPDIYKEDVMSVAQRIILSLQAPYMINGHEVVVTASIGISFYRNQQENAKTLMKHADIAMYTAKQEGKNTYHIYQPEHF